MPVAGRNLVIPAEAGISHVTVNRQEWTTISTRWNSLTSV